jgi:RNA polymerase sigma factor (sigma-70 family)
MNNYYCTRKESAGFDNQDPDFVRDDEMLGDDELPNDRNLAESYGVIKYNRRNHDLIAESYCQALETFDSEKGASFKTWGYHKKKGVKTKFMRQKSRLERFKSTDCSTIEKNPDTEISVAATVPMGFTDDCYLNNASQMFNNVLLKQLKPIVDDLLLPLDAETAMIVEMHCMGSMSLEGIASELNKSKSTVDRKIKGALSRMRNVLLRKGITAYDVRRV